MHSPDHEHPESMEFKAMWPTQPMKVETHRAVKVYVKANILEIARIDQTQEAFTAVFTLHMYWVDPALRDFRSTVKYLDRQGNMCEVTGSAVGCCGYNHWTKLIIQKDQPDEKQSVCCNDKFDAAKELQHIAPTDVWDQSQPDWDNTFRPKWSIMNVVGKEEVLYHSCQLLFCSSAGGHVFEKYKLQATFKERLELHDLPFDKQVLRMKFVSEVQQWKVQFVPLSNHAGNLSTRKGLPDAVPAEWRAVEHEGQKCRLMVTKPHGKGNLGRFDVLIHFERDPSFYIYNVVLILFLLTGVSWSAFFNIDPEQVTDRASVQFISLLATIGFKQLTVAWLPVKPYLTFMDKYILFNFVVQVLTMVESTVIVRCLCRKIEDDEDEYKHRTPRSYECDKEVSKVDEMFAMVLYAALVFWHLMFIIMCQLLSHSSSRAEASGCKCSECCTWICCSCNCCGRLLRRMASLFRPCRMWQDVYQSKHVLQHEQLLEPNPDDKECPWGSIPGFSDSPFLKAQWGGATGSVQADAACWNPTLLQNACRLQAHLTEAEHTPGSHHDSPYCGLRTQVDIVEEKPKARRTKTRRAASSQDAERHAAKTVHGR
eukprot:TRINITY_DN92543_c0_g1_i1.p1 TRINITY_DN92543_c0_g1~~TRINITY_DN92543_c0_g1_i1.p1  ORF type:complete len:615 (-),score=94.88 TRINITY_DN92543_c0_g1_i1:50-1840(-)